MQVWLWQDLCTVAFQPPTCAQGKYSLSFHCILLEHQAKQLDADRCLTLKPFPIFNVNYYFLFVHRHEQAGQKNKLINCVPGKTVRAKVSRQLG